MGNGAKAAQKRERANEKGAKTAKSQLKTNEQSKTILCKKCRTPFMSTTREPQLAEHAQNKHSLTFSECFA